MSTVLGQAIATIKELNAALIRSNGFYFANKDSEDLNP
jgi:hypothetical protein